MEDGISQQQARVIAVCIAHDIRTYIDDHQEEYQRFLIEYGYGPANADEALRAC